MRVSIRLEKGDRMGEIKSALEIALERTKEIKGDKSAFESEGFRKQGMRIISSYLDDPEYSLDGCFKDVDKSKIPVVREGMFNALMSNLVLAQDANAINKIKKLEGGFLKLIEGSKKIKLIFEQLEGFYNDYLEGKKNIREKLFAQYEPRLRKKAEALAKQLGTPVHLDAESDPEFVQLLRQNFAMFDERYSSVLGQVKDEIKALFDQSNT
jgi:hypothetical protein